MRNLKQTQTLGRKIIKSAIYAVALLTAGAAQAATTGVQAVFSGSDENVPTLTLTNIGDTGSISGFSMTVGPAATYGIDGWENPVVPLGVTPTYNPNDFDLNGGGQYDTVGITFTGFTSGLSFSIDFDVDTNFGNTVQDYRTDFLPGGLLVVEFTGGTVSQIDFDLTPASTTQSSYTYSDTAVIPVPAGLPLMLTALAGAAVVQRRRKAT